MRIAIIGAGFSGLAAAADLSQDNKYQVELIEARDMAGGLALDYRADHWQWALEEHYHHSFNTDQALKQFLKDIGLREQLIYRRAKSSTLYKGQIWQLDNPLALLQFKEIPFFSRLRVGAVLAFLKFLPSGMILEKFRASQFLQLTMGKKAWQVMWEPLFKAKFGRFSDEVNLSWFWARVHPRTAALGYFNGGFGRLATLLVDQLKLKGVKFRFSTHVAKINKVDQQFILSLQTKNGQHLSQNYDLVISTLPSPIFKKLIDLPEFRTDKLLGLASMTMVLRLKQKLLKEGTYWLNINEKNWPFVAIVEHDNMISAAHYNGESLVYLGRYLEIGDPAYQKSSAELLNDYLPYLQKLDPDFTQHLISAEVFKAAFTQPISLPSQSRFLPQFTTSLPNLYWVCMQHVYPFDRGINHAIASARKLAKRVKMDASSL